MSIQEILSYIRNAGIKQDLGFGNTIYWDENQNSWIVTDGDRIIAIDEAKALELVEELVTQF